MSAAPGVKVAMEQGLSQLRRCALAALALWAGTDVLYGVWCGRMAILHDLQHLSAFQFAGHVGMGIGFPVSILWIGGVLPRTLTRLLWGGLAAGGALLSWGLQWPHAAALDDPTAALGLMCAPNAALALVRAARDAWRRPGTVPAWIAPLGWLALSSFSLSGATANALRLTPLLFPLTWDHYAYLLDSVLSPSSLAGRFAVFVNDKPALAAYAFTIYNIVFPSLCLAAGLALRLGIAGKLNIWRVIFVLPVCGWIGHAAVPLCGPACAFGMSGFPGRMPPPGALALLPVQLAPLARSAMPSMHLSAALLVWLLACASRKRAASWLAAVFVLSTGWAALALGEHYLIDLIVALPFSASVAAVAMAPRLFTQRSAIRPWLWACVLLTVAWWSGIRLAPLSLAAHPNFMWPLVAACAACAESAFKLLIRALQGDAPVTEVRRIDDRVAVPRWIAGMFFFSGLAGLMYEVVFSKALAVTFGSTALANYTVLATYMGGMAVGAWLGGQLAERLAKPLVAYAGCEAVIGCYAVLTPLLFAAMQHVYTVVAADVDPASAWLTVLRLSLGVLVLGLPTVMMGATLPLMFKHVKGLGVASTDALARLYGANVLGAAGGCVVAGYVFLPATGRNGATFLAAAASLAITLCALNRARAAGAAPTALAPVQGPSPSTPEASPATTASAGLGLAVLIVGGAVTLGLEIVYMHLLAVVAGNSAYAFALMLFAFLMGLGIGAEWGRRALRQLGAPLVIAVAQFALCAAIAITAHGWDSIPTVFAAFGSASLGFLDRELIRATVCLLVMLPPAVCIGAAYPAAMSLAACALGRTRESRGVGLACALNTLGNIAGVVLTGFVLLPRLGSLSVVHAFSWLALGLALAAVASAARERPSAGRWPGGAVAGLGGSALCAACALGAFPAQWNYQDLTSGANVYFFKVMWGKHLDHAESVAGGLTSVSVGPDGVHTLLTNGKFQGNDAPGGEMVAQGGFAVAPLLHTIARDSALVIGYGTGMTSRVLHSAGFRSLEIAELSDDVLALADRYFSGINQGVRSQPGVKTYVTDGRNFLLTQHRQFDVISIEISSVWFAGAANLYNKEFYALASSRLGPQGVLQQWVQLHHIHPLDLVYILGSVRTNFRYVWLYLIGSQGVIVASNAEQSLDTAHALTRVVGSPGLASIVSLYGGHMEQLLDQAVLAPADVDRMIGRFDPQFTAPASTDTNLFLEYSTPKGNALDRPDMVEANVCALQKLALRQPLQKFCAKQESP